MLSTTSLTSKENLTLLLIQKGIHSWENALDYVRNLPYGRNTDRNNLALVIKEHKGTCSSKHAFLKKVADQNGIKEVQLILCIYKMTEKNTAGIGKEIENHHLTFIPEAHCYLKIGKNKVDVTQHNSNLNRIEADILKEIEITPEQVGTYKVNYHKTYLKTWLQQANIGFGFDEIWAIREKCIQHLSRGTTKR